MLQELLPLPQLTAALTAHPHPVAFAPAADRRVWNAVAAAGTLQSVWRTAIVREAEKQHGRPVPELTAGQLMDYIRTGCRTTYEKPYFARRQRIGLLALAEAFEYRGRYLEGIIDAIWQVLGEPEWCVPAHCQYQPGDPLATPYVPRVDLFSAVTGMVLAETVQLLGPELQAVSPSLMQRIRREVVTRVVEPVEQHPDQQWWLGGRNNWTPWCSSNVAGCALTFLDDPARTAALLTQLLAACERFLAGYPADGGCEEGPMYWQVAAGKLLILLQLLEPLAGGALETLYALPQFRKIGEYPVNVHLYRDWFLSPADSRARNRFMMPGPLYRFGLRCHSEPLMQLASAAVFGFNPRARKPIDFLPAEYNGDILTSMLRNLFWLPPDLKYREPRHGRMTLLPDLQIGMFREDADRPGRGLLLSLKGGYNGESHNHNDLGQFELFCQGQPVMIDLGTAVYGRQNFSEHRYELWYVGAQGHNVPEINGIRQPEGDEYRARILQHSEAAMELDLAAAYPADAGIRSYSRRAELGPESGRARIVDRLALREGRLTVELPLYTALPPQSESDGRMVWTVDGRRLTMTLNGLTLKAITPVPIDDPKLGASWGKQVWRIELHGEFAGADGEWSLEFRRE